MTALIPIPNLLKFFIKILALMFILAIERSSSLPLVYVTCSWLIVSRYRHEWLVLILIWGLSFMLAVAYNLPVTLCLMLMLAFIAFQEYERIGIHQTSRLVGGIAIVGLVIATQVGWPDRFEEWLAVGVSFSVVLFISRFIILVTQGSLVGWWRQRRFITRPQKHRLLS